MDFLCFIFTDNTNMRRQSDDYSRSHLSDVFEESEADLVSERSPRSIKSKSPDSFPSKPPKSDRKISNQGTVLTTDTDSFIIGQRIWVGGIRPGLIAYIGETHFAPGEWAGVVLDDPNGKNDGCVAGKRYFQCEPKRGIFSRLTRLTREPLPGGAASSSDLSMNVSSRSITSPSRSGTVSPTQSMKSFSGKTPTKSNLSVGDRVIVSSGMGSKPGMLQYIGETKFAPGNWCGVQLDEPSGKNDGSVDGVKYFDCPANFGIFVPIAKVSLSPSARKPRLSRTGSKESLTSVGTLGSIASTATSRMRMSAQRLSSTAKPITTPKNTFSLQEVLREKQNHIEHLLIERDLDRQDSENNTMMYQKTINQKGDDADRWAELVRRRSVRLADLRREFQGWHGAHERHCILHDLRETIASLEKKLESEKQKSEDLQTSIDEATFCSDELNVLNQDYKDRIATLEAQLSGSESRDGKTSSEDAERQKQNEFLIKNSIAKETERITLEITSSVEAKINQFTEKIEALEANENNFRDQVLYLTQKNEKLEEELRLKDETKEQEYLNVKHIENELREEIAALKEEIKIREDALTGNDSELQKLIEAKDIIISEYKESAIGSEQLHLMIVKQKDEEIASVNASLQELQKVNELLGKEKSNLNEEIEKNASRLLDLEKQLGESTAISNDYRNELEVSRKQIVDKNQRIEQHENVIKSFESRVEELLTLNSQLKEKESELLAANTNIGEALENGKILEAELRKQIEIQLGNLDSIQESKSELEMQLKNRDKCIEEEQKLSHDLQVKNKEISTKSESLEKELNDFRSNLENKDDAFVKLSAELKEVASTLTEKNSQLEKCEASLATALEESKVLSEQNVVLTNETEHLKTSVANLNAKIESLEDVQKIDKQTVETLNKEISVLNSQIEDVSKVNLSLNERLKTTESVLESEKLESQGHLNLTKELKEEIDGLQKLISTKNEETEKLLKTNVELQVKLEKSVQNGTELLEKLSKLEIEHGDISRKMNLLEDKHEQLLLEKASLQQNINALQNSSSDTNSEVHRLSAELQQKQKSYEELVDKSNSIQLNLEKKLHEVTQNLAARTAQWEGAKNEMDALMMQKIDRENELNLELSKIKEATVEEKVNLEREIDSLKISHQEEKASLLKEIDTKLKDSEGLRGELYQSIEHLEKTVQELQRAIEQSKNELLVKEETFDAEMKKWQSVEMKLKHQLDESIKNQTELRSNFDEITRSGVENVEQLTKQLNEKSLNSEELERQLKDLLAIHNKVTEEHGDLTSKLAAVEKENEELAQSLAEEKETLICTKSKLEQQLEESKAKFQSTEDEQVDLVNRNVELVRQVEELSKAILESTNSKSETNNQLTNVLSQFEAFKLTAETEKNDINARLTESLNKETDGSNHRKLLESQNAEMSQQINEKQKEIEVISSSLDEVKQANEALVAAKGVAQEQINSLQNEQVEHIRTIRMLEDKIEQLTSSVNLSDDLKNELNHKAEEIKSKEMSIAELKQLIEEQEADSKRSMDAMVSKDEQIKSMQLQFETMNKSVEGEMSSLSLANTSLTAEVSRLNVQLKEYAENFVDRTQLNNLKEEFSIFEETKRNEIFDLTQQLRNVEERLKNQSEDVNKLEILERKQKEMAYAITTLERKEAQLVLENKQLTEKMLQTKAANTSATTVAFDVDSGSQISFLNSIIADMQKKNETLIHRIEALESAPADFVNNGLFDLPVKRQPAPRLFCDICDEFDAHETEDCPLQASDSPPPINLPQMASTASLISKDGTKERKLPPPRKYCDNCEVFGHDTNECDIEETY
ncbi:Restin like [Pseudolycoriella hygida]|uniref:Restin like n=1 Tax=Pseudolycoriella hygida TaxID=35572 RepID=A0A9Q0NBG2_9DIPT|nr:Restin like [Pseudolycoriella hygida]